MTLIVGPVGALAQGTTSVNVSYPVTGLAAGDLLFMGVAHDRPDLGGFPTISGWTKLFDFAVGSGVPGTSTGERQLAVYVKDVVEGTESGTVTVTPPVTTGACSGAMIAYRSNTGGMIASIAASETGEDTTAASNLSCTAGSVLAETAGNFMVCWTVSCANSNMGSQSVSATGATYGTATERVDGGTNNGNRQRTSWMDRPINSGTATAATVYTTNITATVTGGTAFFRIEETTPPAIPGQQHRRREAHRFLTVR